MTYDFDETAKHILKENDLGTYTVPTKGLYPYQWNWDSVFVALGFATYNQERAWLEIETLFASQWDNGFVPHIIFHKKDDGYFPGPDVWQTDQSPPCSGITQPPVTASVVKTLCDKGDTNITLPRLRKLFPKILACHRWFHKYRDPLNKGLVLTVHPWETGRDNSPEWDKPASGVDTSNVGVYTRRDISHVNKDMRPKNEEYDRYIAMVQFGRGVKWDSHTIANKGPFRVFDVCMSMILLRADRDLMALAKMLGEEDVVEELNNRISLAEANIEYLWDDSVGAYCSRDQINGEFSGHITSGSFLAFYAGVGSDKQHKLLLEHFERIASKVEYMLPSLDPESSAFDSIRYWRGPVWSVVNYMCAQGLADYGYTDSAQKILDDTKKLVEKSGFYEAFCPLTGEGTGGNNFSWTAAIWLDWKDLNHDCSVE